MARSLAFIRAWSWGSMTTDQRRTLLVGVGLTLLNIGVLIFIMVAAASQS